MPLLISCTWGEDDEQEDGESDEEEDEDCNQHANIIKKLHYLFNEQRAQIEQQQAHIME